MGYKDDRWAEAPGYCVECGALHPLTKSAVCKECWNADPSTSGKTWEEDAYCSHWYYERLQAGGPKKGFVIFGDYVEYCAPRTHFKILAFVVADTPEHAYRLWKKSAKEEGQPIDWILEEEIYVVEIEGTRWVFNLDTDELCQTYRNPELNRTAEEPGSRVPEC